VRGGVRQDPTFSRLVFLGGYGTGAVPAQKRRARGCGLGCRLFLNLQPCNLLFYIVNTAKGCRLQVYI
jgi:hypothetical protein